MIFDVQPGDDFIWNQYEFVKFLSENQGQDIVVTTTSEGCSAEATGMYKLIDLFKFNSVIIKTCNAVEEHSGYDIRILKNHFLKMPKKVDYTAYHHWTQDRVFGAFYSKPVWYRMGLASTLLHDYPDKSLVNFRYDPHNEDLRKLFEIQKLFKHDPVSAQKFIAVMDQYPIQLEETDVYYGPGSTTITHTSQLAEYYTKILVDIVSESFTEGRTFFPTEKTIRPMLLKKPFITMGPKCFLIHLRQMGFKTFHDFWDEDYDGYNPKERYFKILEVIKSLASKSPNELVKLHESMQDVLEHNYNLLVTRKFTKDIKYVE